MGSRNIGAVVTPTTKALNALIYGYGGHSLVTPHHAIQQIWWTDERIEEKVTSEYVSSRLRSPLRERLEDELSFGDGLTSDTYLDWILERSRRFFLILSELGIPDQIFKVIDNSWDDDDLPLSLETIQQLSISYQIHEQLDRKFFDRQYHYLLREVREGGHVDYGLGEIIPLDYVHKIPPAVPLQSWNRIHLPLRPEQVFARRKIPLEIIEVEDLLADIETSRLVENAHVSPVWASYTSKNVAYFLTTFLGQHTLKTFIDHRTAPQYTRLSKHDRLCLLMEWMHCLATGLAALHESGLLHTAIHPSNILIDEDNVIAFSDIGSLRSFQLDKKPDPMEAYIYAAPELQSPYSLPPDEASERAASTYSKSSSERSFTAPGRASTEPARPKGKKFSTFSFDFGFDSKSSSSKKKASVNQIDERIEPHSEASDVYSLGCVFLDIISFGMKKKASDFTKHRSSRVRVTKGNPNMPEKKNKAALNRTDSSFHHNPDKIASWMKTLEDQSFDKDEDAFRAIPQLLRLVGSMVTQEAYDRPTSADVRDGIAETLANYANMRKLHCHVAAPVVVEGDADAKKTANTNLRNQSFPEEDRVTRRVSVDEFPSHFSNSRRSPPLLSESRGSRSPGLASMMSGSSTSLSARSQQQIEPTASSVPSALYSHPNLVHSPSSIGSDSPTSHSLVRTSINSHSQRGSSLRQGSRTSSVTTASSSSGSGGRGAYTLSAFIDEEAPPLPSQYSTHRDYAESYAPHKPLPMRPVNSSPASSFTPPYRASMAPSIALSVATTVASPTAAVLRDFDSLYGTDTSSTDAGRTSAQRADERRSHRQLDEGFRPERSERLENMMRRQDMERPRPRYPLTSGATF